MPEVYIDHPLKNGHYLNPVAIFISIANYADSIVQQEESQVQE